MEVLGQIRACGANSATVLGHLNRLSIASWNSRALLHTAPRKQALRKAELLRLLKKFQVVCVQETHGTEEDMA
eukprot:340144-Karenia_brevis.AAC.1